MQLYMTLGGIASLCGVFLFLTTLTVLLRFLARYKQKSGFKIDDWLVAGAWLCFVGLSSLIFYGVSHKFIGYDQPKDKKVLDAQHPTLERVFLSLDGLCIMVLGLVKLSALFFFRRIFCTTGRRDTFDIVSVIYIAVAAIWTIVFFVMTWNLCGHHSINWDVQVGHSALCKLDYPYFKASTASDLILEVFILSLPVPKIWNLNMTNSRKLGVMGIFFLAVGGMAASIARLVITLDDVHHGVHVNVNGKIVNKSRDAYRTETQLAYCMVLEAGFTIVSINLPALWYGKAGIKPESALRSVRSLVSLGSGVHSQQNSMKEFPNSTHPDLKDATQNVASTSMSSMKPWSTPGVESYAMSNMSKKPLSTQNIHVDRDFRLAEDQV